MVATLKNRTSSAPRDINSIINWLWQLGDALVFGWDQVLFLLMKIRLGIVERYFDQLGHPFDVFVAPLILLLLCNCSLAASSTSWFIKIISLMRRRQSFGHVPLCMPLSVATKGGHAPANPYELQNTGNSEASRKSHRKNSPGMPLKSRFTSKMIPEPLKTPLKAFQEQQASNPLPLQKQRN